MTYTYDLTNGMKTGYHYELQTDETGTTKTVYDTLNRVVEVTTQSEDGEAETATISYYDNGARKQVTYGDGSSESYTYYGNNLVKGVTNKLADGTVADQFSYVYDGSGNLKSKIELANGVMRGETTYTYDAQNRLETVTNPDGSTITYTYDKAGNRATETTVENGVKTYTYNGRNQLLNVVQTLDGVTATKTEYTYDANGNQLSEKQTTYAVATESGKDETVTVLTNSYDLRNQLERSETSEATIVNTYNAAGYRVAKAVTKDGETSKTYFLYDGNNVIMEADEEGVTAKNTYGGPLLLRTVFGEEETTYEYLYNAHGDVVTLISDGEVAATYYYDSFGNILEQTGEVSNSILYAGYQYDEETSLYYINARMYDPVTARFLQADTYLGNTNDPLSLNLYTYCLNNPHKYVDPSGHSVLLAFLLVTAVSALLGAGMEYVSQKYIEKRDVLNYDLILFEGVFNAIIGAASMGMASAGVAMLRQAGKLTVRTVVRTVAIGAAMGTVEGAIENVGRQIVTGTSLNNLDYGEVASSAGFSGVIGGMGAAAGVGLDALKQTRIVRKLTAGVKGKIADFTNVLKGSKTGKYFRELDLQFFARDDVYQTSYGKSSGKYNSTLDFVGNIEKRNGNFYTDKSTIDAIGRIEAKGEDFSLLGRKKMNSRPSTEGGLSAVYRYSDGNGTRYMIHEVTDNRGFIIHRDFDAIRIPSGQLINKR